MRECPTCGALTIEAYCPVDGARTIGMAAPPRPDEVAAGDPPVDLPRAWDAPAPRRRISGGHPTLFFKSTQDIAVGAAEVPEQRGPHAGMASYGHRIPPTTEPHNHRVVNAAVRSIAPPAAAAPTWPPAPPARPDRAQAPAQPNQPAAPVPRAGDDPRHALSELPWLKAPSSADPGLGAGPRAPGPFPADQPRPAAGHRAASRMSGGWGDDLFGGVGKIESPAVPAGPRVVTSEQRPHPIPTAPARPPQAVESDPLDEPRDTRGLIATLLVLALVGGAFFFGGQFAWEKLQKHPTRQTKLTPPPAVVPPPPIARDQRGMDEDDDAALEERPLLVYQATLGPKDHLDTRGQPLEHAWQVVVQDRLRVHLGEGDAGDTKDTRFASKQGRAELSRLLRIRRLPDRVRAAIHHGTPRVEVTIWPEQATVRLLRP